MDSRKTPSRPEVAPALGFHDEPVRARRPRGLVGEIVESLASSIREGRLQPGEKLPTEAEIMARFDVSRTVVRESLSKLQASGLVETRHGIGTFVLQPQDAGNFRITAEDFATVADVMFVVAVDQRSERPADESAADSAGTVAAARRIVAGFVGAEPVRSVAADARADLVARAAMMLDAERRRLERLLESVESRTGRGTAVRVAAELVEAAR